MYACANNGSKRNINEGDAQQILIVNTTIMDAEKETDILATVLNIEAVIEYARCCLLF